MPSVLPMTVRPASGLWSQVEYVACMKAGFGFAAHRTKDGLKQWFHYKIGDQCVSLLINGDWAEKRVVHQFQPELGWVGQCSLAVQELA